MRRLAVILLTLTTLAVTPALSQGDNKPPKGGKEINMPQGQKVAETTKRKKQSFEDMGRQYIYGVGYSPADSVVYMTDMLFIDALQRNKRTKFIANRHELSAQLRKHLAENGEEGRICSVVIKESLNALDKDYNKQVKVYRKKGYTIKNVDQTVFRFNAVRVEEDKE